jgi:O-antigen/teichoic acid export membrane protein
MTSLLGVFAAFGVILVDLSGRALLDKVLALVGSPGMVAMWAQLQSVVDLVSGVTLTGVAQGLTVLIAQARNKQEQAALLGASLRLGPLVSLAVALLFLLTLPVVAGWLTQGRLGADLLRLAAVTGCLAVIPGLMSAYWLGLHRQLRVLQFALLGSVPLLLVALAAFRGVQMTGLALVQCAALLLVALPMGWYLNRSAHHAADAPLQRRLAHFIVAGLAIGIMSPASMLLVRGTLADALSWNEAGLMQALWRSTEWVTSCAAGVLSLIFLPRFSAACGTAGFRYELRRAALAVLLPSAVLLGLIYLNQRAVLSLLYDARFAVSDRAAALFMLGSLLRIAAWVFLFALFAARRAWLIGIGEVLSLPLFAWMLWHFSAHMTLELASLCYCITYLVYLLFNAGAVLYARPWAADSR